ncbi:hypothetical protein [Streptomyces sp. NPDC017993]|uniref:hypothetical protein n=1 Tax=Streptomyces sp. NPDC017993 TaxID=3365027 RepID=UPI0037B3AD36
MTRPRYALSPHRKHAKTITGLVPTLSGNLPGVSLSIDQGVISPGSRLTFLWAVSGLGSCCPADGGSRRPVTDAPVRKRALMEQQEIEEVTEELPEFALMIDIPSED